MMALALIHFRPRANKASLLAADRHYRAGDVQVVSDNPSTGSGEEGEEYLLVTLPGIAADWPHLVEEVTDIEGRTVKIRRYYIDLSKLKNPEAKKLEDRKPFLSSRRTYYEILSAATHQMNLARLGQRQAAAVSFSPLISQLDNVDTELVDLRMEAKAIDATWVIDRGET